MGSTDNRSVSTAVFYTLGTCLMVLVLLFFGKDVFVPIALSCLLSFVLNPLVVVLEKWHLGRVTSVVTATFIAFAIILSMFFAIGSQVRELAVDLPNHRQEIKAKLSVFQYDETSTWSRLTEMFHDVFPSDEDASSLQVSGDEHELIDENITEQRSESDGAITRVIIERENESAISSAVSILLPAIEPIANFAFIVVLVMFLLIRREDVRYRLISLIGETALTGTTRLMQDAADRLSRYLLFLLMVNAGFGLVFGIGLYLLGVPYAPLWGFLTLCLRFIPYLGSPASLLFPLLISIATSSGWMQPVWVLVFFAIAELITSNIVEPILFGKTTGLTPIALLIAALFWAWIWGPIGLLLSTPLTVCLVVLGQHLPHLRSLKVLLAELPVLDTKLQYFQRLLANDLPDATKIYQKYSDEHGMPRAFDQVLIPALIWTRRERLKELISPAEEMAIWKATREMIEQIAQQSDLQELSDPPGPAENSLKIYCYPVHHESEELALLMLREILDDSYETSIARTIRVPSRFLARVKNRQPDIVVLASMPPGGFPQIEYMCKEVRERCPHSVIIVVYFDDMLEYDDSLIRVRRAGGSYLTTSLVQARHQIDAVRTERTEAVDEDSDAMFEALPYSSRKLKKQPVVASSSNGETK